MRIWEKHGYADPEAFYKRYPEAKGNPNKKKRRKPKKRVNRKGKHAG